MVKFVSILALLAIAPWANAEIKCGATLNGNSIVLEENPARPGVYFISEQDPSFDRADVILDVSDPKSLRATLARFVANDDLQDVKDVLAGLNEEKRERLRSYFKSDVVTVMAGFSKDGEALVELTQEPFHLAAACRLSE